MSTFISVAHGPLISQHRRSAMTWKGLIVARSYTGDPFTAEEYREILKGGKDYIEEPHRPGYILDDAQRLLDNLCLDRQEFHNVACNVGRTQILNYIVNNIASGNIASFPGANVFAIGNGAVTTTPPAQADTQLLNEFAIGFPGRIATASGGSYGTNVSGNTADISALFATVQANGTYTEAGAFAVTGTLPGSTNSGTLFAHAVFNYTKTSAISLTVDYFITLT